MRAAFVLVDFGAAAVFTQANKSEQTVEEALDAAVEADQAEQGKAEEHADDDSGDGARQRGGCRCLSGRM